MVWVIKFDAPAGRRVKSRFLGITNFTDGEEGVYWSFPLKRWLTHAQRWEIGSPAYPVGSHAPCRSYKAFLRHLRKHPELVDLGVTAMTLVSRWAPDEEGVATDIQAVWEEGGVPVQSGGNTQAPQAGRVFPAAPL